jgi:hypothetical protein
MKLIVSVTISAALLAFPQTPRQESLREHAVKYGGTAENVVTEEYGFMTIDDLVAQSDLIVHGKIAEVRPHLTPDESLVVTDYRIQPIRILQTDGRTGPVPSPRPGQIASITVRRTGGIVTDGNYRYSTRAMEFSQSDDIAVDEPVILFLNFSEADASIS